MEPETNKEGKKANVGENNELMSIIYGVDKERGRREKNKCADERKVSFG